MAQKGFNLSVASHQYNHRIFTPRIGAFGPDGQYGPKRPYTAQNAPIHAFTRLYVPLVKSRWYN